MQLRIRALRIFGLLIRIPIVFRLQTHLVQLDRAVDILFLSGLTVLVYVYHILHAVMETERAVDTSAVASHALKEVLGRLTHL